MICRSEREIESLVVSENSCESICSVDSANSGADNSVDENVLPSVELPRHSNPLQEGTSRSNDSEPVLRMGLNIHKAGMEGLDRERINEIILSASKGSKYYENEMKKETQATKRIAQLLSKLKQLTEAQKSSALVTVNKEIETLEKSRVLNRVIVHIDMDAFFAAVEMRDDPSLRDVPMAVGGQSMLSTSNYIARRFGVRAAMPGFIGKKLCPNLVIVKENYHKYKEVSKQVGKILSEYDPQYSQASIDESYLDLTNYLQMAMQKRTSCTANDSSFSNCNDNFDFCTDPTWSAGIPESDWQLIQETVQEIRDRIYARTRLTASAGIAPNMLLAKITSDMNKPNGQYFLPPTRESVLEFVRKLPIRKVSGIGKVSERLLNAMGVQTCQDIHDQRASLYLLFSKSMFQFLLQACLGIGSTEVFIDYERKSLSTERTFAEIDKAEDLDKKCMELCESLAEDLARHNLKGSQVTLKMKTVHFIVKSRSAPTAKPVHAASELYKAASELLKAEIQSCSPQPLRLRLMGVRVSSLMKKDSGKQTLDFYAQSLSNNKQHSIQSTPVCSKDTASTSDTVNSGNEYSVLLSCPVCNKPVCDDNYLLNSHIDMCLNQQLIGLEENASTSSPRKHKSNTTMTANVGKKAKSDSLVRSKSKTLHDFWKKPSK